MRGLALQLIAIASGILAAAQDSNGAQAKHPDVCALESGATVVLAGSTISCTNTMAARSLSEPTDSMETYVKTVTTSGTPTTFTLLLPMTKEPSGIDVVPQVTTTIVEDGNTRIEVVPSIDTASIAAETGTLATITGTIVTGTSTKLTTFTTTLTSGQVAASTPLSKLETSGDDLCRGPLKRHATYILWKGMPNRTDIARVSADWPGVSADWPYVNEVAAATNALMGLMSREKKSHTNEPVDVDLPYYIPEIIFGAGGESYTSDEYILGDPEASKVNRYQPRVRVNEKGELVVSLNLFPMSDEDPLKVCVKFDLEKKKSGDKSGPIWWMFLHEAFDHPEVQKRLKDNAWYPEKWEAESQFTTMAMLEMLTGYKTEYIFENIPKSNEHSHPHPSVIPSGKGNPKEYEKELAAGTSYGEYQDWMLGPGEHNSPIANWNPTVMMSEDTGIRALRSVAEKWAGASLTGVILQDSRAWYPFDVKNNQDDEFYDRVRTHAEVWGPSEDHMLWIARLKLASDNKAPLANAAKEVGDDIRETGYFKLDDTMT